MEESMRDSMKKLALWYTRTFKPIMSHDELEPIMATLGFIGLPPSPPSGGGCGSGGAATTLWKEYCYTASGWFAKSAEAPPRPRLPYPRIDGLHIYTYRAFLDSVNFFLEMCDVSDLFHIRGMPLYRTNDRTKKWRQMDEDDSVFVYREGTLDQATYSLYHQFDKQQDNRENSENNGSSNNNFSCNGQNSLHIRGEGNNKPSTCLVSLKDIIV